MTQRISIIYSFNILNGIFFLIPVNKRRIAKSYFTKWIESGAENEKNFWHKVASPEEKHFCYNHEY